MAVTVDRRKFLRAVGAAGAATGVAWVAPTLLGSPAAFAAGSCVDTGALRWTSVNQSDDRVPRPRRTRQFTVQIAATGGSPAIHVQVTVTPVGAVRNANSTDGQSSTAASGATNGGVRNNGAGSGPTGNVNGHVSFYGIQMTGTAPGVGYDVRFDFYAGTSGTTPVAVHNLAVAVHDIDRFTGTGSGSGRNNPYNDSIYFTPGFTEISRGAIIAGSGTPQSPYNGGTNTDGVTDDSGTVEVLYPGAMNSLTVSYRTYEFNPSGTHQMIGIGDLNWCY